MTQIFESFIGEAGLRLESFESEPAGHGMRYADALLVLQALASKLLTDGCRERNVMIYHEDSWVGYVMLS